MEVVSRSLASLWDKAREIEQEMGGAGLDAVEGRRFLLRMLAASVDMWVEDTDVDRPRLQHAESPTRKMFADCPDTDYLRAPIALGPGRAYRISGRIPPGTLYVGILLYGKGGRIGNRLSDRDLVCDANGRFEVSISTEEQSGTWLRGDGDETAVIVRQYFADRATEPPIEVDIEYLGKARPAAPLAPETLADGIARAERMLGAIFKRTRMAHQMAASGTPNSFFQIKGEDLFPTPDNLYSVAWYRLGDAGRLLLRGRLPEARYFALTLYNAWLESYDFLAHTVSLNHKQIAAAPDGSFEITLSDNDPGGGNWLDTAGHREGYVLARALLPAGDMPDLELALP